MKRFLLIGLIFITIYYAKYLLMINESNENGVSLETDSDKAEETVYAEPEAKIAFNAIVYEAEKQLNQAPEMSIDVTQFGAVGDGETDDYEAVYNAIDIAATEGKALYFPKGIYYLSKSLMLRKDITLIGAGMGHSIKLLER